MSKFESATSDSWIRWWAIANARCNLACEQSKEVEWFVHVLKQRSQPLSCNQRNVNPSGILRWVTVTLLRGGTRRGKGKNTNSECWGKCDWQTATAQWECFRGNCFCHYCEWLRVFLLFIPLSCTFFIYHLCSVPFVWLILLRDICDFSSSTILIKSDY